MEGFAAAPGNGRLTTTGGIGGRIIRITSGDSIYQVFRNLRIDKNPQQLATIVEIVGTLQVPDEIINIKETANVTILGKGNDARLVGGGLAIQQCQNIIIRNIEFSDCPDDGLSIEFPETHHIWVDHCTFNDGPNPDTAGANHDGALDIKRGAAYITISWCHFSNHSKTCLLGHSDSQSSDTSFKISYHHNWFEKTRQRHPRVRYGKAHVYNNYYDSNDLYGVASTCEADVYMEANYFKNVPHPSHCGYADSPPGDLVSVNNVLVNSGLPETRGQAFNPSSFYTYRVDDPTNLPLMVQQYSGSGKIDFTTDIENGSNEIPSVYDVLQSYPNPFNPFAKINFVLSAPAFGKLVVFDMTGSQVAELFSGFIEAGREHNFTFNGTKYVNGFYIIALLTPNRIYNRKILLIK